MRHLNLEEKLSRARTQLLLNSPFFGTLCLRLKLVCTAQFPTMATNGRLLAYNPAFVESLTPAELEGTFAHEVMHCALGHHCRRGNRDPRLWNEACDHAINPLLLNNGMVLPSGALVNPAFANLSAEEIYAKLLQQPQQAQNQSQSSHSSSCPTGVGGNGGTSQPKQNSAQPGSQAGGQPQNGFSDAAGSPLPARPGGFGEVLDATSEDGKPASQAEISRQVHEWGIAAEQAIRSAKLSGCLPGGIDRLLEKARQSTQDWRSILRDFIAATTPSDYRWTPPNRRFVASGLYLPSVERIGVGELVIAVDTSGSIGTAELEQFAGEITAIADEMQPERIHIVYCDTAVQAVEEFGASEAIRLTPKGGGGTDFVPPFRWVAEQGLLPKAFLYLTDLCCHSFPEPPDYPVLWVTDSARTAPFGETLRIAVD
jgi:predicted metal-dependent peptidase